MSPDTNPARPVSRRLRLVGLAALAVALGVIGLLLLAEPDMGAFMVIAVIAMGKCGGRELNYASDVDVIFVAAPAGPDAAGDGQAAADVAALRTATALASGMIRACSLSTAEGPLFPVDPNLRPEGRDGPLVRTVASHKAYYERWAKTWEFQAPLLAVARSWRWPGRHPAPRRPGRRRARPGGRRSP